MPGKSYRRSCGSSRVVRSIPVVVRTTSTDPRDLNACYQGSVSRDVRKPVGFDGLMQAIQRLEAFWCEAVVWPQGGQAL
jgi:hypothetical protein